MEMIHSLKQKVGDSRGSEVMAVRFLVEDPSWAVVGDGTEEESVIGLLVLLVVANGDLVFDKVSYQ